jgi:hypothetical protein
MVVEFSFWTGFVAFARKIGAMYYARHTLWFLNHALIVWAITVQLFLR